MAPYIFGKRNTIHIIDIRETVKGLLRAKKYIGQAVAKGEEVLFVGTKRQARPHIRTQAGRVNMPFVAERWLGGTLTNFRTIRSRLGRLEELEAAEADGTALQYSKKMIASRARETRKIRRNLEGIRNMTKLPGVLVIIDAHRERNAVREAQNLGIPTVCLIDTDSDPDFADIPIPGNDDAMRSIEVVLMELVDAIETGIRARKAAPKPDAEPTDAAPRRRSQRPTTARAEDAAAESEGQKAAPADAVDAPAPTEAPAEAPAEAAEPGLASATASEPESTK